MAYKESPKEMQERLDRYSQYIWSAVTGGKPDSAKNILDRKDSGKDVFSKSDKEYIRQKTLTFPCRDQLEAFWNQYDTGQ